MKSRPWVESFFTKKAEITQNNITTIEGIKYLVVRDEVLLKYSKITYEERSIKADLDFKITIIINVRIVNPYEMYFANLKFEDFKVCIIITEDKAKKIQYKLMLSKYLSIRFIGLSLVIIIFNKKMKLNTVIVIATTCFENVKCFV